MTIEIGGRDTFDTNGNVLPVGGRDVVIPASDLTLKNGPPDANGTATYILDAKVPAGRDACRWFRDRQSEGLGAA